MISLRKGLLIALVGAPLAACNTTTTASLDATTASPSAPDSTAFVALASPPRAGGKARQAEQRSSAYFVEFRSRYAASYGHTFLVHGRLNANGEIGPITPDMVAGLHPASESPVPWMVGHVVPVISETGASDGDTEEEYVSARYRVVLDEAQYRRVAAHIRDRQKNSPMWHAVLYNCNAWVGDIARFMGLKAPVGTLQMPPDYINELRQLNTAQTAQVATESASQ